MRVLIILLGFVASVAVGYPHTNEVIDKVLFQPNDKNLVEKAAELGLTTLLELATTAGLADTLATGGKCTFNTIIVFNIYCTYNIVPVTVPITLWLYSHSKLCAMKTLFYHNLHKCPENVS